MLSSKNEHNCFIMTMCSNCWLSTQTLLFSVMIRIEWCHQYIKWYNLVSHNYTITWWLGIQVLYPSSNEYYSCFCWIVAICVIRAINTVLRRQCLVLFFQRAQFVQAVMSKTHSWHLCPMLTCLHDAYLCTIRTLGASYLFRSATIMA